MLQQLTITTTDKAKLKPLVESAIRRERQILTLAIQRTRERLAEFEDQYDMSSTKFERRLNTGDLQETVEFTDWRMELGMLRLLQSQQQALEEARLD